MLKEKFIELLKEKMKDGKKLSDSEMKAKMGVLDELKSMASDAMGEKIKGMQEVRVAAPDEEGLKEGLEKAEELIEAKDEMMEEDSENEQLEESLEDSDDDTPEDDDYETEPGRQPQEMGDIEEEHSEEDDSYGDYEEMTEDELEAKIAELMKRKEKMKRA